MLRLFSGNGRKQEAEVDIQAAADEHVAKVAELRAAIGPLEGKAALFCTDDCLQRYLRARNWDVRKAEKMLRNSLKWRAEYNPEDIRWADVELEGRTGKMYRLPKPDKMGRAVMVMRPGLQNTNDHDGQIRHLVYMLENACHYASELGHENIVWLIDFARWSIRASPPFRTSKATLDILQNQYPERLGLAILYNTPRLFSGFWRLIYPLIDPKTREKVKFIGKNAEGEKVMEEIFKMAEIEAAFGGSADVAPYDHEKYGQLMVQDDEKRLKYWSKLPSDAPSPAQADGAAPPGTSRDAQLTESSAVADVESTTSAGKEGVGEKPAAADASVVVPPVTVRPDGEVERLPVEDPSAAPVTEVSERLGEVKLPEEPKLPAGV